MNREERKLMCKIYWEEVRDGLGEGGRVLQPFSHGTMTGWRAPAK